MGILDIFGGSPAQKAQKLKAKVTQKYGDPLTRQKAMAQLGDMKVPEAINALMARYTITVEPLTTDAQEKEHVFGLIKGMGSDAVEPVKAFLRRSDHASSWAVRLLEALVPETEVVGICVEALERLGREYSRDPEKKQVLIQYLAEKDDPRIAPVMVPLLEDMSDDVKIAAAKALGPRRFEAAREPLLRLLTSAETARRVQTAAIAALSESEMGVQGYREKVEALLPATHFIDKSGILKKQS